MKLTEAQEVRIEQIVEMMIGQENTAWEAVNDAILRRAVVLGEFGDSDDIAGSLELLKTEDGKQQLLDDNINEGHILSDMRYAIAREIVMSDKKKRATTPDNKLASAAIEALDACFPEQGGGKGGWKR